MLHVCFNLMKRSAVSTKMYDADFNGQLIEMFYRLHLINQCCQCKPYVQINTNFLHKMINIFLSISFSICFGCLKEPSH